MTTLDASAAPDERLLVGFGRALADPAQRQAYFDSHPRRRRLYDALLAKAAAYLAVRRHDHPYDRPILTFWPDDSKAALRLDVHGFTREPCLCVVDDFVGFALAEGLPSVDLLHGRGDVLAPAVRQAVEPHALSVAEYGAPHEPDARFDYGGLMVTLRPAFKVLEAPSAVAPPSPTAWGLAFAPAATAGVSPEAIAEEVRESIERRVRDDFEVRAARLRHEREAARAAAEEARALLEKAEADLTGARAEVYTLRARLRDAAETADDAPEADDTALRTLEEDLAAANARVTALEQALNTERSRRAAAERALEAATPAPPDDTLAALRDRLADAERALAETVGQKDRALAQFRREARKTLQEALREKDTEIVDLQNRLAEERRKLSETRQIYIRAIVQKAMQRSRLAPPPAPEPPPPPEPKPILFSTKRLYVGA